MEQVIMQKDCGVLFRDSKYVDSGPKPRRLIARVAATVITPVVLAVARMIMGGLWVGGAMTLTSEELRFVAAEGYQTPVLIIPLRRISSLTLEKGLVTGIIQVDTPDSTVRLRCYDAPAFLQAIDEQRHKIHA